MRQWRVVALPIGCRPTPKAKKMMEQREKKERERESSALKAERKIEGTGKPGL